MRHRIGGIGSSFTIGLGNPDKAQLSNAYPEGRKGKRLFSKFLKESTDGFFSEYGYVDFGIADNEIAVGVEPAYMYERLKIIRICRKKEQSSITDGYAFGGWGTGVVKKTKRYDEYKKKTPFIQFVDKWHNLLFL